MLAFDGIIGYFIYGLELLAAGGGIYALIHAIRQRPDAFTAVDKLTKPIWIAILVVATLVVLGAGFFGLIIGTVAIAVYLVDVRPRLDEIQRRPRW